MIRRELERNKKMSKTENPVIYADIVAMYPEINAYVRKLRPIRNKIPYTNPWHRYEKAKRDIAPLIPDIPGAYEVIVSEICRRLNL